MVTKHIIRTVFFFLLLGLAAFFGTRAVLHWQCQKDKIGCATPEIAWMRKDLGLNQETFARVAELHRAYLPVCAEMCRRIDASGKKLHNLASQHHAVGPELVSAMAEDEKVRSDCRLAMLQHLYATAAVMSPEQAERFLKLTLPSVSQPQHATLGETVSH